MHGRPPSFSICTTGMAGCGNAQRTRAHPISALGKCMFGIPIDDIAWLAGAIVAGGLVTGMLAGMFGIGGGGIIVPVLFEVFRVMGVPEDVRMQLSVGTSIAIIVPTNIRSYLI